MSWDDEADTWDDNPAVQTYSRAAFRSLIGLEGLTLEGKRVLDFGCGTGLADVEVRIGFSEPFEGMTMAPLMGIGRTYSA